MNRVITLFLFFLSFTTFGQGVLNKGAYIIISPSTSVTITGSSGNFNNGSSSVTELNGSLYLQGDFTNNGSFNSTSGVITFNGNNDQIAGGNSTTFYNLVDSNFYQLLINMPVLHVKNQLSLKGNKIFLQNNEIKLGSYGSPPTPGILIRTSG